jgi:hypothetical protein
MKFDNEKPIVSMIRVPQVRDGVQTAWYKTKLCVMLVSCFVVMFEDYRLTPNGLVFGILAILALATAVLLHRREANKPGGGQLECSKLLILLPTLIAALCYLFLEDHTGPPFSMKNLPIFSLNLATSALTMVLGASMVDHKGSSEALTCFALVGFAAIFSYGLGIYTYLSPWQMIGFLVCVSCSASDGFTTRSNDTLELSCLEQMEWLDAASGHDDEYHKVEALDSLQPPSTAQHKWSLYNSIALVALAATAWCCFLVSNFSPLPIQNTPQTRLDREYKATSSLDIVISMYQEPASTIKSTYHHLSQIPAIAVAKTPPRLIVYTKDPWANTTHLQHATGATKVVKLANVGREGHTYLHHISTQWDELATQTFFLQADIHNARELFPRVKNYYTQQTGMLSLGFSGKTCRCGSCGDRFGWWDHVAVAGVWLNVTGEVCGHQRVLLSYKGQFVASAARLRANGRLFYQGLRDALAVNDSWAHADGYLKGREDSPNAPFLGYTVERMWSVILQCSEMRIAALCPTLLSGSRRGGSREDCQCLDT